MQLTIGISGASGRIGQELLKLGKNCPDELHLLSDKKYDLENLIKKSDILIDFSAPQRTQALLEALLLMPRPIVIGTTGLEELQILLEKAACKMPLLQDYNMSLGIHRMAQCLELLAASMEEGEEVDLLDIHHAEKKDAPSGTSFKLARAILGENYNPKTCFYSPLKKEKREGRIGLSVERRGTIFGEHHICFTNDSEEISLAHRAFNRTLFAKGALKAAKYLHNKPAGRYSMSHLL